MTKLNSLDEPMHHHTPHYNKLSTPVLFQGSSGASSPCRPPRRHFTTWLREFRFKAFRWCVGMLAIFFLQGIAPNSTAATLPSGFVEESIGGTWNEAIGLTFAADGRMFVWERAGRVWVVVNGAKASAPLIDISDEVGAWKDHGLSGFALDPDFLNNGYFYLLYVVDHHHLANFGTPNYSSSTDDYFRATIGRLTRYTVRASDGHVDPASRRVLVGESVTNAFPILFTSHGLGSLVFGDDGTLLVSCGDGGSSTSTDVGSASETYYQQALAEGIIQPRENVGTYRAQLTSSLAGKIVRLDPATGDGVPGNPFFNPAEPRSARSRIWAMGLRNPFRMTLRPGTGSHRVADGRPGVLLIGDVGYLTWEELDVCVRPGMNFGWPVYEGMDLQPAYSPIGVVNQDAPNPLFGSSGCSQPYFAFRDLIKQATLGTVSWANPCDVSKTIPGALDRFVHSRPAVDWKQGSGPSRVPTFSGTNATTMNVGASGAPVTGPQFGGNCSIGGTWYTGNDFPAQYRNTYFHGEYGALWIKNVQFDSNNVPVSVRDFASNAGGVVSLATHPLDGGLYYITWTTMLKRVRYVAGSNQPPVAVATLDRNYGPAPLMVQFSGTNSIDPEGLPLSYQWNFGDGTALNTNPSPAHLFNAPAGVPTRFDVKLRVTDRSGASSTNTIVVSVNNTPPQVTMISPANGSFYSMAGNTVLPCTAVVSDAEHDSTQLTCTWQTILHHNNHIHTEPADTNCATTTVLSPVGCNGETYFYQVVLTVVDGAGLSTTQEARLYPFCTNLVPTVSWANPAGILLGTALSASQLNATANVPGTFLYSPPAGTVLGAGDGQSLSVTFIPDNRSNYVTTTARVTINIAPPFPGAQINFQPASSPVPAGYLVDSGLVYGPRTNGLAFGWNIDNSGNTKDRDSTLSLDQRYDTYIASQKSSGGTIWQIAVPNDIYSVHLVAGDASNFDSVYKFTVENSLALDGIPVTTNRWISGRATVTVSDGQLTVNNAPGATNNKLCFIEISRHGALLTCSPDVSVEDGAPWTFTAPSGTVDECSGSPVAIGVLSTVTNNVAVPKSTFAVTRSWRATDSCGNTSVCSQTISVMDTTPPTLTCATNKMVPCGVAWNFDPPVAVDQVDGTNVQMTIAGTLTNNTSCALGFQATRTWRATDAHGNVAECSQTVSIPPAAHVVLACASNRSVEYGTPWNFDAPTATSGSCEGNPAPVITGTVTNVPVGSSQLLSVTRAWQVMDSCGNMAVCSQTVTVVDTTPPSFTCATNVTIPCGTPWNFVTPLALDQVDGTNVTIQVSGTLTNISCALGFRATRSWRAVDAHGNSADCSQTVSIAPPVTVGIACAANKTIEYGNSWSFDTPVATSDNCSNPVISVTSTITNVPAFSNQLLSATRVWKAVDNCGNQASCSQTITVVDSMPPVLTCASSKTIRCGTAWDFDRPTAVDPVDGTNVLIVILNTFTNRTCAQGFQATRIWRAFDKHGNSAACSQTVSAPPQATVSGTVYLPTNYPPVAPSDKLVASVTLLVSGDTNLVAETGSDGTYVFAVDAGRDLQVVPVFADSNAPAAGVTTVDLSVIRRHILNIIPLDSPYKLLAADVNGSDTVTTLDISIIRKMILGAIDTFPAGNWRFIPADYVFLDPTKPWDAPDHRSYTNVSGNMRSQDFVAIKLGDVNNSWSPPVRLSKRSEPRNNALQATRLNQPAVTFEVDCPDVGPGERMTARVKARGVRDLTSAQFTLAWDPAVLKFEGQGGHGFRGMSDENFGSTSAARGKLVFSWDDPGATGVTLADGVTVFTVTFAAIGSAGESSRLALLDELAACEAGVNFEAAEFRARNALVILRSSPLVATLRAAGN